MGFGEVIGNRSVHWKIVHEDKERGEAKDLSHKVGPLTDSANELEPGKQKISGHDRIPFDMIGTGKDEKKNIKDHPGSFRVRARFQTLAEAQAAALWAYQNVEKEGGMFAVVIDVKAIAREQKDVDPARPLAEVRIDW